MEFDNNTGKFRAREHEEGQKAKGLNTTSRQKDKPMKCPVFSPIQNRKDLIRTENCLARGSGFQITTVDPLLVAK